MYCIEHAYIHILTGRLQVNSVSFVCKSSPPLHQTVPQSTEMEVVSGLGLAFGFWFFGENNSPTMSPLILPPPPSVLIGGGGGGGGPEPAE